MPQKLRSVRFAGFSSLIGRSCLSLGVGSFSVSGLSLISPSPIFIDLCELKWGKVSLLSI